VELLVAAFILAKEGSAIRRRVLRSDWGEAIDLVYRFVLTGTEDDVAHTSTFNPPNEYLIESNPTGVICILRAERRQSWIKRLFSRL
jgi:hypothetical protein